MAHDGSLIEVQPALQSAWNTVTRYRSFILGLQQVSYLKLFEVEVSLHHVVDVHTFIQFGE